MGKNTLGDLPLPFERKPGTFGFVDQPVLSHPLLSHASPFFMCYSLEGPPCIETLFSIFLPNNVYT